MPGRVDGKVAFVTGAARGQGRSHALRLAEEGADIIAVDICEQIETTKPFYTGATEADLAETVHKVEALGQRIVATKADVRDREALREALDAGVAALGRLDIVSANAGIFTAGDLAHEVPESAWREVVDINLTGAWQTCAVAVPHLIASGGGGSIIITSSIAGLKGAPHLAPYVASKHGLIGLMRTLAIELAPHRIRVNTVHPTAVDGLMIHNEPTYRLFLPNASEVNKELAAEAFQGTHLLPVPWIDPVDVSNAVLFLASDEARYVTGAALPVDAGFAIR